jgi:N-acyl-D-amino-acid deacylase
MLMGEIAIINGQVIDGSGAPAFEADVLISGERIKLLGRPDKKDVAASEVIEAAGLIVAPGFIDIHAHADFALLQNGLAPHKINQGVTTEIIGNCGTGPTPANAEVKQYFDNFLKFMFGPIETEGWNTVSDYLAVLEQQGIAINTAYYVPHGIVRMYVMGMESREPTATELEQMKELVRQGIKDGAIGISTGLIYPPGSFSKTDELVELARVVGEFGGLYATHIRDEADHLPESIAEAIEIGERAGVPVQIAHHKAVGKRNWGRVRESLTLIEAARKRGVDVTADQYPYTASSTILAAILNEEGLGDPADVLIASTRYDHSLEGKSLAEIIEQSGKSAQDAVYDLMDSEEGAVTVVAFGMSEDDIKTVMRHPTTFIGSDGIELETGKPHPRVYGTFPRVLGKYVREEEVLSLEEAISKMTSLPAKKLGLKERGLIAEGMYADITVFDAAKIRDKATYQDPHNFPEGIHHVIVNGEFAVRDGKQTEARTGKVLRKGVDIE